MSHEKRRATTDAASPPSAKTARLFSDIGSLSFTAGLGTTDVAIDPTAAAVSHTAALSKQQQLLAALRVVTSDAFELMELKGLCSKGMHAVLGIVSAYCESSYLEQICEDDEPLLTDDREDLSHTFRKAIHELWQRCAHTLPDQHRQDTLTQSMDRSCVQRMLYQLAIPNRSDALRYDAQHMLQRHGQPCAPWRHALTVHGLEEYYYDTLRIGHDNDSMVRQEMRAMLQNQGRRERGGEM